MQDCGFGSPAGVSRVLEMICACEVGMLRAWRGCGLNSSPVLWIWSKFALNLVVFTKILLQNVYQLHISTQFPAYELIFSFSMENFHFLLREFPQDRDIRWRTWLSSTSSGSEIFISSLIVSVWTQTAHVHLKKIKFSAAGFRLQHTPISCSKHAFGIFIFFAHQQQ